MIPTDTSGSTGPFSNAYGDGFQCGFGAKIQHKGKIVSKNGDFEENLGEIDRMGEGILLKSREFQTH